MNLTADEVEVIAITIHETGDTALEQRFRDAARPSGAGKPPTDPAWGALTRALVVEGIEARKANRPADLTGVVLDHRPSIEGAVLATIANPAPAGPDVPMSPADIQRLITAARLAAPAGLDVEQLERALIAMATQNDPLEPGEVLVSIALEPDDPALLAGNIAYYYNLAEAAARPSGEWFCPGGWKLEQHYDPDAARPSGDAHGELDARLWHSAVCKNAADRPSGVDFLRGKDISMAEYSDTRSACPRCGEWRDNPTADCAACGLDGRREEGPHHRHPGGDNSTCPVCGVAALDGRREEGT